MTLSLTQIAIQNNYPRLFGCLFEKLVREKVFKSISDESVEPEEFKNNYYLSVGPEELWSKTDKSVEPLLYIGVEPTPFDECDYWAKPSEYVVDVINRSRVLSLFKILYPKYIFFDVESIIELVQTLELDGMY
jgi:hypothetical protein